MGLERRRVCEVFYSECYDRVMGRNVWEKVQVDPEAEFEPDSNADREARKLEMMVERGRQLEASLLGSRHAVALNMMKNGNKINIDTAGQDVMNGANLPFVGHAIFEGPSRGSSSGMNQGKAAKDKKKDGKKKDKKSK